jgi:hypothetical protein
MRTRLRLLVAAICLVVAVSGVIWAPAASASEQRCRGTLGAVTVGDLRVPAGATCTLNGTLVDGSITVGDGATLAAHAVKVTNNIQATRARNVTVDQDSWVDGNIDIRDGGSASILDSSIGGSIQFDENRGAVAAIGNTIGNNLQADENTGGVTIADNTIDGNLQCKDNRPRPVGGNNDVDGDKQGQCRGL